MKKYKILQSLPTQNWDQIPVLFLNESPWLPQGDIQMCQQICYDRSAIYIHQSAKENYIRAEHHSPLSMVCEDSCMEFFFSPMVGDDRYFNFEWNLNGCLYLGLCTGRDNAIRLQPDDPVALFDFRAVLTADGWEIFYKIPISFIKLFFPDFQLIPGATIRANCYKCGDKTVAPHYLTWNPITSSVPDFHRPRDFGEMVFAD